jgi:hypothetical protein
MSDTPPSILVLCSDLFFTSKINAEARAAGSVIEIIRNPAKLTTQPGRRLIVDLNLAGAIAAAGNWRTATGGEVVGFVGHTDEEAIAQARAAGLDQIMARSRFVQVLPKLLAPEPK